MSRLAMISLVVDDYDLAIEFFVGALDFELVEDSPATTSVGGNAKRWVVVKPRGGETAILLARADGESQAAAVGNQTGGRVGFFLQVDDFDSSHDRMVSAGVEFLEHPRTEIYGKVAVFRDLYGNKWDLIQPADV